MIFCIEFIHFNIESKERTTRFDSQTGINNICRSKTRTSLLIHSYKTAKQRALIGECIDFHNLHCHDCDIQNILINNFCRPQHSTYVSIWIPNNSNPFPQSQLNDNMNLKIPTMRKNAAHYLRWLEERTIYTFTGRRRLLWYFPNNISEWIRQSTQLLTRKITHN